MKNQKLFAFIRSNLAKELSRLTERASQKLINTVYIGLKADLAKTPVPSICKEVNLTETYAAKLLREWRKANAAPLTPDIKNTLLHHFSETFLNCKKGIRKTAADKPCVSTLNPDSNKNTSLGFRFTKAQENEMDRAIRESIAFMAEFGQGTTPRTHGEYYEPGKAPKDDKIWISENQASLYLRESPRVMRILAEAGILNRRQYKNVNGKLYWEYELHSLEQRVKNAH